MTNRRTTTPKTDRADQSEGIQNMTEPERTDLDRDDILILNQALDEAFANQSWLDLLGTFAPLGLADMLQLQQKTNLDRERVRAMLKRIEKCTAGGPAILKELSQPAHRAGVRGRAPQIYRLEPAGAALLQRNGYPEARASTRSDELELIHAVCVLDIRLAAQQAGLQVETERSLKYSAGKSIRPDNLISLADGTTAIFETEQQADPSLLRRISENLQNKLAFYNSAEGKNVSPIVRMVLNVTPGAEFHKTLKVWQRVYAMLVQNGEIPFRLLAMPLVAFRDSPDWSPDAVDKNWTAIRPLVAEESQQSGGTARNKALFAPAPKALISRTMHDNRLTIEALWLWFQEQAGSQPSRYPQPDPEFFEIMQIIYAASHDSQDTLLEQASVPWASLYLLDRYLEMHPQLRKSLNQAINRGGNAMRWNPTTILHRMQVIVDIFLHYHGWRSSGPLAVFSSVSWNNEETHDFGVTVRITNRHLLMNKHSMIVPQEAEKATAERALAWVLYALFAYAAHLHLSTSPFW